MKAGGFDAVIGNPPYVRSRHIEDLSKQYFSSAYSAGSYQPDLFAFFVERGVKLLRDDGRLSFILPNGILTNTYYSRLRRWLLDCTRIEVVVDLKDSVFPGAAVDTSIFVLSRDRSVERRQQSFVSLGECLAAKLGKVITPSTKISQALLGVPNDAPFNSGANSEAEKLNQRIRNGGVALGSLFEVKAGMKVRKELVATSRRGRSLQEILARFRYCCLRDCVAGILGLL